MNEYGIESFINWCDNVSIAQEGTNPILKVGLAAKKTKLGMMADTASWKAGLNKRFNSISSPDECDDFIALCDKCIRMGQRKINGKTEKEKSFFLRDKRDFANDIRIAEDFKRKAIQKKSQLMKG